MMVFYYFLILMDVFYPWVEVFLGKDPGATKLYVSGATCPPLRFFTRPEPLNCAARMVVIHIACCQQLRTWFHFSYGVLGSGCQCMDILCCMCCIGLFILHVDL